MSELLHEFITRRAATHPEDTALLMGSSAWSYERLANSVLAWAGALRNVGIGPGERVAVYLPKRFETVAGLFGAAAAGAAFVPINPLLKPRQVAYILRDCNVRVLLSSADRLELLAPELLLCADLHTVVSVDRPPCAELGHVQSHGWAEMIQAGGAGQAGHRRIDMDMCAILYTSGSTGQPKGVVLSHRNMVAGAHSVASYLDNRPDDRLLAVLPFSFDYGLSQLTTSFSVGASAVLMDYLLPRDVIRAVARYRVTGLAAVPPLWLALAQLPWPEEAVGSLRYLTNSGGAMPKATTAALREALPNTQVFLMYGLTEAFRSTYLPPAELDRRPESMGKAIPNAEIMVVREDGSPCAPGEPGELVHRGALVSMGYWNAPEKTAARFKPVPGQAAGVPLPEMAVWSGDTVRRDEEGFLYFVGRRDEMIKTSGYRVSPTEIEEVVYATGMVSEAVALGLPHPSLGQGIALVAKPAGEDFDPQALLQACKRELANFMVPQQVVTVDSLPRNPNGKIDRRSVAESCQDLFTQESAQ